MNIGRISTNFSYIRSLDNIQSTFTKLSDIQEKINTGKEINRPSDDPVGLQKVLALGTSIKENQRYVENIDLGINRLNAASSTLGQVEDVLLEINDILSISSSDAATSAERAGYVSQVDLFLKQLVNLANSSYQGKFIFDGTPEEIAQTDNDHVRRFVKGEATEQDLKSIQEISR